jgi:endonuclease/exonuclease/phosphatase family metal-dependent hydrolase
VIQELEKRWTIVGRGAKLPADGVPQLLTYPSENPGKWIDFVLVRPAERWLVSEVRALDEPVTSDHRPLLAVLRRTE